MGGGGRGGGRLYTKEAGMQRVNLPRIPLPCEQRGKKWEVGATKVDERVRRGKGEGGSIP